MKGRYLIAIPVESRRDEKRFDSAWGRFADLCRSLNRDGLQYEVEMNLAGTRPHVVITARGTAKPPKRTAHRLALPPRVPAQRCRDRALEASWFLPENAVGRKSGTSYWAKHQARYQELSILAEEYVRADMEYWRELELLSGQRQHFKPGLSDETAIADDQVAA
ncbi:MAG: hypothetical protein ABI759_28645 [Candidatus Solibacter sp.]